MEIKTGEYTSRDFTGLLAFSRRNPDYRPMVICDEKHVDVARKLGVDRFSCREYSWG